MGNRKGLSLALLSGKGGSGKTVLALTFGKVLSETGLRVLVIDFDVATHGASYFFETELGNQGRTIGSVANILRQEPVGPVLNSREGFYFLPSTTDPARDTKVLELLGIHENKSALENYYSLASESYDVIIFDCQAGYSPFTEWAVEKSHRKLIVLEPDSVSTAALRVLDRQLGQFLRRYDTWQVFNKLTEEERPIYEKVSGGTLFPNIPPLPFDWQVRAAFSLGEVPKVIGQSSAFGLAALRVLKTMVPEHSEILLNLEKSNVGNWYEDISRNLVALSKRKEQIMYEEITAKRRKRWIRTQLLVMGTIMLSMFIVVTGVFKLFEFIWPAIGAILAALSVGWGFLERNEIRLEKKQDVAQEELMKLDLEIQKYRTLIATDPRVREYLRERPESGS